MTLGAWIADATARLTDAGIESPRLEAEVLLAKGLGQSRSWVLAHRDDLLPAGFDETTLHRRLRGEPLAYILGEREFYSRRFLVGPGALVPRQETELLVDRALAWIDQHGVQWVLDVGSGSGCIAVTVKLERPHVAMTAVDIDPVALEWTRQNAAALGAGLTANLSDLFSSLPDQRFDLILVNPPYVARSAELPRDVANFEPPAALYSDDNGLGHYRRLAQEGIDHLNPGGAMILELGAGQSVSVAALFASHGWSVHDLRVDLNAIPRVLTLVRT